MTQYHSFEDILDDLMLDEDKPTAEALARWQQRYPRYRQALAEFFETWADQEAHAGLPLPEIDEEKIARKTLDYAMEILRKQGRILPEGSIPPLAPLDELVLTAIYLLHGQGHAVNITEKVGEMQERQAMLGSVLESLDRLQRNHLVSSREAEVQGKTRECFTVTLRGDSALAHAKETSNVVARFLENLA